MTTTRTCPPVEEWAPIFAYYAGTQSPKYNDSQIETLGRQGLAHGWCNLGDCPVTENHEAHLQQHLRDLRAWRRRRAKEAAKKSAAGLAAARKEKALQKNAEALADLLTVGAEEDE